MHRLAQPRSIRQRGQPVVTDLMGELAAQPRLAQARSEEPAQNLDERFVLGGERLGLECIRHEREDVPLFGDVDRHADRTRRCIGPADRAACSQHPRFDRTFQREARSGRPAARRLGAAARLRRHRVDRLGDLLDRGLIFLFDQERHDKLPLLDRQNH